MSFALFTDACSNLPGKLLARYQIHVLPCSYTVDGVQTVYNGEIDAFDAHAHYELLRAGKHVQTSLLNTQLFLDSFRPALEAGQDILYVGMSSGISGTYQAAMIAKEELEEEFPDRFLHIVDSRGCGFGSGLLAIRAAELSRMGTPVREAAALLDEEVPHMCQYFTVDDLNFLKRSGRVSGATAMIGTVLNIKPVLWGDPTGHITARSKQRGRKKALAAIAEEYKNAVIAPETQRVAISHGDCEEEALRLAELIRAVAEPKELIIAPHEPFTGAHVGPGMLALFFHGKKRTEI